MIYKLIELVLSNWEQYFPGVKKPGKVTPLMAASLRNVIFFLFKDNESRPFAQAKIGSDDIYINCCKNELAALKHISDKNYATLLPSCSKTLYSDMFDGRYVQMREFLPGKSIQDTLFFSDKFGAEKLQPVFDWVAKIYLETRNASEYYDFSEASYSKYLEYHVALFKQTHSLSQKDNVFLDGFIRQARSGRDVNFNIGFEHGDLNPGNVMAGPDGFFLIDWAQVFFNGFPMCDLINFFIWYGMIVCPEDVCRKSLTTSMGDKTKSTWITKSLVKQIFFSDNKCSRTFKNYILTYMKAVNLDASLIKFLFTAFSVRQPVFELFQLLSEEENKFIFNN